MSLLASYTACCDYCDMDTGDSRPTVEEAIEYAKRGGWVHRDEGLFCDECNYLLYSEGTVNES
jgi:hypothetical protein